MESADGLITNILIQKGIAHEGNPVLVGIAGEHSFLILKIVGVLVAVLILWDIHRRYPRLAFWTGTVFLIIYCLIVSWNLHLLIGGI
jgi:hypothetical protein